DAETQGIRLGIHSRRGQGFQGFRQRQLSLKEGPWLAQNRGRRMNRAFASLMALAALGGPKVSPESGIGYPIITTVSPPGGGGWDYVFVDASARRVYISHARQVEVLDADTFEPVGTIPNTPGVHGIAVASEFGRGFITAGKSDSVIIFDLKSLKPLS